MKKLPRGISFSISMQTACRYEYIYGIEKSMLRFA